MWYLFAKVTSELKWSGFLVDIILFIWQNHHITGYLITHQKYQENNLPRNLQDKTSAWLKMNNKDFHLQHGLIIYMMPLKSSFKNCPFSHFNIFQKKILGEWVCSGKVNLSHDTFGQTQSTQYLNSNVSQYVVCTLSCDHMDTVITLDCSPSFRIWSANLMLDIWSGCEDATQGSYCSILLGNLNCSKKLLSNTSWVTHSEWCLQLWHGNFLSFSLFLSKC